MAANTTAGGASLQNGTTGVNGTALLSGEPLSDAQVYRDEILDGRTRIVGYRFRVVSFADASVPPSAARKMDALKADNLASFARQRLAIVPITIEDWQTLDYRQFATRNMVFHVGGPRGKGDVADWRRTVDDIKTSGAGVALDWTLVELGCEDALDLADIVFVKPSEYSVQMLGRVVEELREHHRGTSIAADDVGSWSEYRSCLSMGIRYCLGDFTATPYLDDEVQRQAVLNNVLDNKLVQFYWYRVFECGCEAIDRDHQALFVLATDLLNGVMASKPAGKVTEMVDALFAKAIQHFAQEEAVLAAVGYPHLLQHAQIHRELADKATRLISDFKAGKAEIGNVFQFLAQDLIVNHMLGADRDFFPIFLQPHKKAAIVTLANGKGPTCPLPSAEEAAKPRAAALP